MHDGSFKRYHDGLFHPIADNGAGALFSKASIIHTIPARLEPPFPSRSSPPEPSHAWSAATSSGSPTCWLPVLASNDRSLHEAHLTYRRGRRSSCRVIP